MNYIWSMKIILFIVFSKFILPINGRTSNEVRKTLSDGSKIIGRYQTTLTGREILGFIGIPYAEPPIGELRFKAPVPKAKWEEPLMTIKDSNKCLQLSIYHRNYNLGGAEDCLYLNVYTPLDANQDVLPVMVFFHGGSLMIGSTKIYTPDYLLEHRIVLVTANYRLGPLGFLSTGTRDCPGNFGIKDQLLVLKWVRQNIKIFNGNINSVTVFGEGAGGASITYLMQSQRAKGLIHRAIVQSGVNMNPRTQPTSKRIVRKRTRFLAQQLNCNLDSNPNKWVATMKCLRQISVDDIILVSQLLYRWEFDTMIPFSPVVEPHSPEAIITEHPRFAINTHGRTIPLMIGMNVDEGTMISAPTIYLNLNDKDNWSNTLNLTLFYNTLEEEDQRKIRERIQNFYFNNIFSTSIIQNLTNLYTDSTFLAGIDEYLRKRLLEPYSKPAGPTYVYLFAHKGSASYTEIHEGGQDNYYGVCHGDELRALFPVDDHLFINSIPTDTDITMRTKLTKMWVNFAYSGDPTPNLELGFKWYGSPIFPLNYLRIGNKDGHEKNLFEMENGLLDERANFWYDLQPHLPPDEWKQCASN